ncbi:hypothetical protein D3C80_2194970 [compost metagenome]
MVRVQLLACPALKVFALGVRHLLQAFAIGYQFQSPAVRVQNHGAALGLLEQG